MEEDPDQDGWEWLECQDEDGNIYYYNTVTQESTWTLPEDVYQTRTFELLPQESRSKLAVEIERARTLDKLFADHTQDKDDEPLVEIEENQTDWKLDEAKEGDETKWGIEEEEEEETNDSKERRESNASNVSSSSCDPFKQLDFLRETESSLDQTMQELRKELGSLRDEILQDDLLEHEDEDSNKQAQDSSQEKDDSRQCLEESKRDVEEVLDIRQARIQKQLRAEFKGFLEKIESALEGNIGEVRLIPCESKHSKEWLQKSINGLEDLHEVVLNRIADPEFLELSLLDEGASTDELADINNKLAGMRQSVREERLRAQQAEAECTKLKLEKDALVRDHQDAIQRLENEAKQLKTTLKDEISEKERLKDQADEVQATLRRDLSSALQEQKRLSTVVSNEDNRLKSSLSETKNECEFLRREKASLEEQNQKHLAEIERLGKLLADHTKSLSEQSTEREAMAGKLREMETSKQALQEKLATSEKQKESNLATISSLKEQVKSQQQEVKRLEEELVCLLREKEESGFTADLEAVKEKESLQDELENTKVQFLDAASRAESFKVRFSDCETKLSQTLQEMTQLEKKYSDAEAKISLLQARVNTLEEEKAQFSSSELANAKSALEASTRGLKSAVDAGKETASKLAYWHAAATAALKQAEDADEKTRQLREELTREQATWREREVHYESMVTDLRERLAPLDSPSIAHVRRKDLESIAAQAREYRNELDILRELVLSTLRQGEDSLIVPTADLVDVLASQPFIGRGPETDRAKLKSSNNNKEPKASRRLKTLCRITRKPCHVLDTSILMANKEGIEICNRKGKSWQWHLDELVDSHQGNEALFRSLQMHRFCFADSLDNVFCGIFVGPQMSDLNLSAVGTRSDPGVLAQCLFSLAKNIGYSNHTVALEKVQSDETCCHLLYRTERIPFHSLAQVQQAIESFERKGVLADACLSGREEDDDVATNRAKKGIKGKKRPGSRIKAKHRHIASREEVGASSSLPTIYTIFVDEFPKLQVVLVQAPNSQGSEMQQDIESCLCQALQESAHEWRASGSSATEVLREIPFLNQLYFLHTGSAYVQIVPHLSGTLDDATDAVETMNTAAAFIH